jgi:hypothetical protein
MRARPEPASPTPAADDDDGVQSLLRGLEASGKTLGDAEAIFGTADLSAFWFDDGEWYDARPIAVAGPENDGDGRKESTSDLVATHFRYILPGVYCPVEYQDGARHLVPLSYIYRRCCQPEPEEDPDGAEERDSEGLAAAVASPSEASIDDLVERLRDVAAQAAQFGRRYAAAAWRAAEAATALRAAFDAGEADRWEVEHSAGITDAPPATITAASSAVALRQAPTQSYLQCSWSELPDGIKAGARRLGYDETLWDRQVEEASTSIGRYNRVTEERSGGNADAAPPNASAAVAHAETTLSQAPKEPYFTLDWNELPDRAKIAARRIGYNRKTWNTDGLIPLDAKEWQDLTCRDQQDLATLGYDESTWGAKDEPDNPDLDDDY